MMEDQIVAMLKADATVAASVGTRIYPHPAPQDVGSPFITYQVTGYNAIGSSYTHRAMWDQTRMQVDCWYEQLDEATSGASQSYGTIATLSRAVRDALDRQGDAGEETIDGILFRDWHDLSDERHARRVLMFEINVKDP